MDLGDIDLRYVLFPLVGLLSVLILSQFLGGCDPELTEEVASNVTSAVAEQVVGQEEGNADLTALRRDAARLESVEVYVDRSLSMKPYITNPQQSGLYRLLNRLGNFVNSETSFYGFGFPNGEGEPQEVKRISPLKLKQASAYTFANNDYGRLLQRFSKGETTNLIVTDGVQSDPKSKAQLGGVLEAIDEWIRSGGSFATLIYETEYHGQYYSDLPGKDPVYNCSNRPLTTFVLGRSPSAINDLIGRFGSDLRPDHMVRLGGNTLPMAPAKQAISTDEARPGTRVLQGTEEYILEDYRQVFRASIAPASANKNGFVPLQFEAEASRSQYPWKGLGEEGIRTFLRNLEPQVQVFAINPERIEQINSKSRQKAASVPPLLPEASKADTLLRWGQIQTQKMSVPQIRVTGDTVQARFEIPARRPQAKLKTPFYALLVRFRVTPQAARMLIPDRYSTDNDLDPSNCGQIYKLQQFVGTIMRRNYAPAQALLLTEWH
ncbi:MAG: hypothetical protein ABEL51_03565 [Salinibacter sp.]